MRRAQEQLLVLLVFLAQCGASWFTINGETSKEFSLCRRLGFYDRTDYYAFLVHGGLAGHLPGRLPRGAFWTWFNSYANAVRMSMSKTDGERSRWMTHYLHKGNTRLAEVLRKYGATSDGDGDFHRKSCKSSSTDGSAVG